MLSVIPDQLHGDFHGSSLTAWRNKIDIMRIDIAAVLDEILSIEVIKIKKVNNDDVVF